MSHLSPSQTLPVRNRIVAATRNGRLQDWNERIGEIAVLAKMDVAEINWAKEPKYVASDVVDYANRRLEVEGLERAIAEYEATHPQSAG